MKYNGLSFYDRLFLPKHDEGAESGLDGFAANMEYDLKMFETVILPFIERERATELKLLKENVAPVHKGKRVQAAGIWVNRRGTYDDEAAKCAVELVDLLLDGRTVNLRSENCGGSTLILNAASVGNRDLVEYLISRGADPYLTNDYGTNAVDCAKEYGYSDILALISKQTGDE